MPVCSNPPTPQNLHEWLSYIESISHKPIDLGLSRMKEMIARLKIHFECPVFTVAGTNGKGSTCAMLEAILRHANYRVGMHTSPHLIRFNERALICGKEVSDAELCEAFNLVQKTRGDIELTYFEFTGLAILYLFSQSHLDAVILEIGLGGRLDAMNAIDTSCGIVCALGIDHTAYLGTTREEIAYEKACIYRRGVPAIATDRTVPSTLIDYAHKIDAKLMRYGIDFETHEENGTFDFVMGTTQYQHLKKPALEGANQIQNAAGVLAALTSLKEKLPLAREAIEKGLNEAYMPGRFEKLTVGGTPLILDVGHNPQAATVLAQNIQKTQKDGEKLLAVFAMLKDKDIASVAKIMTPFISEWFVAPLGGPRGAGLPIVTERLTVAGVSQERFKTFESVDSALKEALNEAHRLAPQPVRILVFGSFVTVAAAVESLRASGALSR